jgi:hypothetical protein
VNTESITSLESNLDAFPPLLRRTLDSAEPGAIVDVHPGTPPSASVRTPSGRMVRIHSGRDPLAEADQLLERTIGMLPGGAPSVVIVIGPGLGYVLDAIERRAPATKVIAIEPFPALARAMLERRDWRSWLETKRLTLLVGPDYAGAGDSGRLLEEKAAAAATIVEHPVLAREFPAEFARARATVDHVVQGARLNAEARRQFAGRYLLNTLRNLPALFAEGDAESLRDTFAGVPALLVAAGPSLDGSLARLRELQDRALIIAVDTTLRPLRSAGIRPHIVVAVDPSDLNARHLLGLEETDGSWLVTEGSIDPQVPPQFAERIFSFKVSDHQPWPWLRGHGFDRGTLRAWGSVLTTAFDLAIHAGCEPIAFVGADLSYPEGVHYCRGTMNEDAATYEAEAGVRARAFAEALRARGLSTCDVLDIHGRTIMSTPQFVQFRDWLTSRALEAAPRRVVNATGGGILFGEALTQIGLDGLSLAPLAVDVHERLRGARAHTLKAAAAAVRTLADVFTRIDHEALPIQAWIDFAAGTISAADIGRCIDATWRTAPKILRHPASRTRKPGRAVSVTAVAEGGPPPHLQWERSSDGGATWSAVDGAITPTYRFVMDPALAGVQVRACFTNRHASATTTPATIDLAGNGVARDFLGRGRGSVIWRHHGTGLIQAWHMDGRSPLHAEAFDAAADHGWAIVGTGDFTGSGHDDLLWFNPETGGVRVWVMHGLTRIDDVALPSEPDRAWQIVGAADVNGNGQPDLLWRNATTGALRIWSMDGVKRAGTAPLVGDEDLSWRPVALGDFNGDGKPDLLWRNVESGANRVWRMDGVRVCSVLPMASEPDLNWRVAAVHDIDGDGRADLLWRHRQSGEVRAWWLDDLAVTAAASLVVIPDLTWAISPEALAQR